MGGDRDPLLDLFAFETNQFLEQIEGILLESEQNKKMSEDDINEVFRAMHSIKGSANMMSFKSIGNIAHAVEDLFDFIRNKPDTDINMFDLLFAAVDFIKSETEKAANNLEPDEDETELANEIRNSLKSLQKGVKEKKKRSGGKHFSGNKKKISSVDKKYVAKVFFEEDCLMESVRAFSLVYTLNKKCNELFYYPDNIEDDDGGSSEYIRKNGFDICFSSEVDINELEDIFGQTLFLKSYKLEEAESLDEYLRGPATGRKSDNKTNRAVDTLGMNSFISVSSKKLDKLLDLVGEIVIAESMVTKHPEIQRLESESFDKKVSQLKKLIEELQDNVMSVRMIPIADTLHKLNRIVRDMSKKLGKEVELVIHGEETEIDKNIVSSLSDPLMHIIRNSMDHGIENSKQREMAGKTKKGKIEINASNVGGEVIITVSDDGRGLDKSEIYKKAHSKGLIDKSEGECSDREVFSCILQPGFSTKDTATEYSGRGVGMDVVKDNISKLGGVVIVDSEYGRGITVELRIPLTMAIIDGIIVNAGGAVYTIPTSAISEFFKAEKKSIVIDTNGNENVMLRNKCIPVVRLHDNFNLKCEHRKLCDGIMILIESNKKSLCLFADSLVGEQFVVTKPLPDFLNKYAIMEKGISGCTILGDGSISLIIDVNSIINKYIS